jgi:hypothetical protein
VQLSCGLHLLLRLLLLLLTLQAQCCCSMLQLHSSTSHCRQIRCML